MIPMLQTGHPDLGREGFNFSAKFKGPLSSSSWEGQALLPRTAWFHYGLL